MLPLDFIPTSVLTALQAGWSVPFGLIVLYFYGVYHFNTPDYSVASPRDENCARLGGQLISLAPPRFTTDRRRFRRYSLQYVLLLMLAFLIIVFCWSAVEDSLGILKDEKLAGDLTAASAFASQRLQYRVIWALFALTGLLASIPGAKDLDRWILQALHRKALIPDGAIAVAERLFEAAYVPDDETTATIRNLLIMRDTKRVADKQAAGVLEERALRALYIKASLDRSYNEGVNLDFQVRLQRDFLDIDGRSKSFVNNFRKLLRHQENIVPESEYDIDEYLDKAAADPTMADLATRRADMLEAANAFIFRLCLMAALYANVTTSTPEQANELLKRIGFKVRLTRAAVWDWEALTLVTTSIFVTSLVFGTAAFQISSLLHLTPVDDAHPAFGRGMQFVFSMLTTTLYGLVILIAILLKRKWALNPKPPGLQNTTIALSGYLAGSLVCLAFFYLPLWSGREFGWLDHVRFAFGQLNLLVAGFFAGKYIDRALNGATLKRSLVLRQAGFQALAALIAFVYVFPEPAKFTVIQQCVFWTIGVCQNALAGGLMSYMVQRFYQQCGAAKPSAEGGAVIGDLTILNEPARHAPLGA